MKQISFIKSGSYSDEYSSESFILQLIGSISRTIWFSQSSEIIFDTSSKDLSTTLVFIQFLISIICCIYKLKLQTKFQKQQLKNPVSISKIGFVGIIITCCVQELTTRNFRNKIALFCFILESSQYMPQIYHSRNDLVSSNRRSFSYTLYQLFSIILRIIFWIIIYNKLATSLFLYHFLFDFMNIYFLKDFIWAYYFKCKDGKIYFKPIVDKKNNQTQQPQSEVETTQTTDTNKSQ